MRRSRIVSVAAGTAAVALMSPWASATDYTWNKTAGGTYDWTTGTNWTPTGVPTGSAGAADTANLSVATTGDLLVNIAAGNYYLSKLTLGSTGAPHTTDIGNGNSGGGVLNLDGGGPSQNAYADVVSAGAAGSTNIISAPIQLDEVGFSSFSLNTDINPAATTYGDYVITTNGTLNSQTFLRSINTGINASVLFDAASTNDITLSGPISQSATIPGGSAFTGGAIANVMPSNRTLTINGPIAITNGSSAAAQSLQITGTTGSNTVINGVISDGPIASTLHSVLSLGNTSPSKTTVYPALSPTITLNGTNTYTGSTTFNMATIVVGNDQAFGVPNTSPTNSVGQITIAGSSNEFGYNLISNNDARVIPNGLKLGQFLTFEGAHSITYNGYLFQSSNKGIVNLLPAGKTFTINGATYTSGVPGDGVRNWDLDGTGLTIDNGPIYNNATASSESTSGVQIDGVLIKQGTGTLLVNNTGNTYRGVTTVNGGLLQFASPGSYGVQTASFVPTGLFLPVTAGVGTVPTYTGADGNDNATNGKNGTVSITANTGAAVGVVSTGSTDPGFLSRIAASTAVIDGALALMPLDSNVNIDFTNSSGGAGDLGSANTVNMSIGAGNTPVTYTGTLTPASSTYRLGGGGTLTLPNAQLIGAGNSLVAANGGTVALNGLNTYGGTTTIKGVYVISDANKAAVNDFGGAGGGFEPQTLSVSHLGPALSPSGIGSSSNVASNLVISGGILQYTGAGDSTDRLFTMTPTGATLDSSGSGAISFTNAGAIVQTDATTIANTTVGRAAGSGAPFNLVKLPVGTDVSSLAVGMTVTDSGGVLAPYAPVTITGIDSTAAGPQLWLSFQPSSTFAVGSADTLTFTVQNRTLTLTGSNTGANKLNTALVNSTAGTLGVNKTGVGSWILSGANTYTGPTTVNAGVLEAAGTGSLPGYNVAGKVSVASGATLAVAVGGAGQFASADIDSLRANATFSSGSLLGIDTTSASSGFSYASNITGNLGLNKLGPNTLTLSGTDTYSGPTTVSQGTLAIDTAGSIPNTPVTVGGAQSATLNFAPSTSGFLVRNLTSLNVANGSANVLAAPTATQNTIRSVLVTPSLTIGAAGKVDLANNDLVVKNTTASSVMTQLAAGFNAHVGYWNGNGIVSSSAAGDTRFLTTLGYRQSTGATFDTVSTTTADTIVKYTYYGDANLDGVVNGADYQQIDMGFGTGATGWINGDFNYDGVINGSDFALIDNTFNQITATGASALAITASPASVIATPAVSAVPEPTTLGLLGIGAASLLGRRRRRTV